MTTLATTLATELVLAMILAIDKILAFLARFAHC